MQDYEYKQIQKIIHRLASRYQITSFLIDRFNDEVIIRMKLPDSITLLRKTFDASEILALSETDNRFYREFRILWLSKAGERI